MLQSKEDLLQELIEKYAKLYMKMAYSKGVPYADVEDVVMEAFWSFYRSRHFGKLSEIETKAMLARIVENKCIDLFRKRKRAKTMESEESADEMELLMDSPEHDPLHQMVTDENYRDIIRCMEGMKKDWRDVAVMFFIEELSVSEICERLEITGDVCRSRISRARKYLKEKLKDRWNQS